MSSCAACKARMDRMKWCHENPNHEAAHDCPCCKAYTPKCMACKKGMTVDEYCGQTDIPMGCEETTTRGDGVCPLTAPAPNSHCMGAVVCEYDEMCCSSGHCVNLTRAECAPFKKWMVSAHDYRCPPKPPPPPSTPHSSSALSPSSPPPFGSVLLRVVAAEAFSDFDAAARARVKAAVAAAAFGDAARRLHASHAAADVMLFAADAAPLPLLARVDATADHAEADLADRLRARLGTKAAASAALGLTVLDDPTVEPTTRAAANEAAEAFAAGAAARDDDDGEGGAAGPYVDLNATMDGSSPAAALLTREAGGTEWCVAVGVSNVHPVQGADVRPLTCVACVYCLCAGAWAWAPAPARAPWPRSRASSGVATGAGGVGVPTGCARGRRGAPAW